MGRKVYCRIVQAAIKIGNYFIGYRTPEYIEGAGCIIRLPEIIRKRGIDNVLLVTGAKILRLGLPDALTKGLEQCGIKYTVFCDIEQNPSSDNVENGFEVYKNNGCKALIAFGGGAPMDCAKAIGAKAARPKKSVARLQGLLKVARRIPPLFAVPTTSGTGSEATVAAVITDSKTHRKASINDPHLIPEFAVLDPELTVALPPFVTAVTGMDALCHAVEAYTNRTYNTKLEDALAKKAVKLIYENLLTAYSNGENLVARQNMQKAAFFAGRAFTRGCVGYVHAVGHTLGGLYSVAHGLAMAVILPHVMKQYGSAVYKRLAELADVCGLDGDTDEQKAIRFIEWIERLNCEMGIPNSMDVIKEKDIDRMILWAKMEANPIYPVPVIWGEQELRRLIDTIRA